MSDLKGGVNAPVKPSGRTQMHTSLTEKPLRLIAHMAQDYSGCTQDRLPVRGLPIMPRFCTKLAYYASRGPK
jgi:hypothetical protein